MCDALAKCKEREERTSYPNVVSRQFLPSVVSSPVEWSFCHGVCSCPLCRSNNCLRCDEVRRRLHLEALVVVPEWGANSSGTCGACFLCTLPRRYPYMHMYAHMYKYAYSKQFSGALTVPFALSRAASSDSTGLTESPDSSRSSSVHSLPQSDRRDEPSDCLHETSVVPTHTRTSLSSSADSSRESLSSTKQLEMSAPRGGSHHSRCQCTLICNRRYRRRELSVSTQHPPPPPAN